MTGQEGFRFTEDPLGDPVFGTPGGEPADGPAAVCHEVVKTYRTATESVTALDGVTLSIPRARVTVVVGPSGSGKSSLLRLLACIERPASGEVRGCGWPGSGWTPSAHAPGADCGSGRWPTCSSGPARTCCPTWTPPRRCGWQLISVARRSPTTTCTTCSTGSGSARGPTTGRLSCPVASSSAWRWRAG